MACDQELCEYWTGEGCACEVLGIERRTCGLCGKVARTRDEKLDMSGRANDVDLCHPIWGGSQDCYHLWTIYGMRPTDG